MEKKDIYLLQKITERYSEKERIKIPDKSKYIHFKEEEWFW